MSGMITTHALSLHLSVRPIFHGAGVEWPSAPGAQSPECQDRNEERNHDREEQSNHEQSQDQTHRYHPAWDGS